MGLFDPVHIADEYYFVYPSVADIARADLHNDPADKALELFACILTDAQGERMIDDVETAKNDYPLWFVTAVSEKAMQPDVKELLSPLWVQSAPLPNAGESV